MNNSKIFSRSTYNDSTYENNFNDIVNLTTLKIKEFTNKKLELQKGNGLLKGQKVTHETDRNHLLTTTNSKDSTCKSLEEEYQKIREENDITDQEQRQLQADIKAYNEELKQTIIIVNTEFENMTITNGIEDSLKKQELKREYENYLDLKNKNKMLTQQLNDKKRELFTIENQYKEASNKDFKRINKAKKALDNMNKIISMNRGQDDEMGEEQEQDDNMDQNKI